MNSLSEKVAIVTGATDTPMGRAFANTPETRAFVEGLYALKRMALPEEIAKSALYAYSADGEHQFWPIMNTNSESS